MTRRYKYLKKGDLKNVAIALDISYDKVKDINTQRYTDATIEATLEKLNIERKKQIETQSSIAVEKIINS